MAEKVIDKPGSPVCFDADINLFAPVEEANDAANGFTDEDVPTLRNTKVLLLSS